MDWGIFWSSLLGALGGSGFLVAVAIWLGKKWIGVRIEESVKHEYATQLEEHKAELEKDVEDHRAQLQEELNEKLAQLEVDLEAAAEQSAADRGLLRDLLVALPYDASIQHISKQSMAVPFPKVLLEELEAFRRNWSNAAHEFLDSELEEKRRRLYECLREFLSALDEKLFATDDPNVYALSPHWSESARMAAVKELEALADKVVKAHDDLVRSARTKLKC